MWFMQTKKPSISLGLLPEAGAGPGSGARWGHLSPVRTQSRAPPPPISLLSSATVQIPRSHSATL